MNISDDKISDLAFSWNYSLKTAKWIDITKNFLIWSDIDKAFLLKRDDYIIESNESNKKKLDYMMYSLLCVRNAIHKFKNDGIIDDFSDLE